MTTEEPPITDDLRGSLPSSGFAWRGFGAGLMNWYLFGRVVWILKDETRSLARSTSGYANCGTCLGESTSEVFFWIPIYLCVGAILWKWIAAVAPAWRHWAMWPVRLAMVAWCGVVGTLLLLPFIPDWK